MRNSFQYPLEGHSETSNDQGGLRGAGGGGLFSIPLTIT